MPPRLACLFASALLAITNVHGQRPENIDSLKTELKKAKSMQGKDSLIIDLLIHISMKYQASQPDSSMAYGIAALELSTAVHDDKGRADILLHIGRLKRDQGDTSGALKDMFEALELYRALNDYVQIGNSLNDISIIYATDGDYEKSLEYFNQALDLFQQRGDQKGESYALNNIGLVYQELGDEPKAKDYFLRSLRIKEKYKDYYGIARGYKNLGSIAEKHEEWGEALSWYTQAVDICWKMNDINALAGNYNVIARVKSRQGHTGEARKYAEMALKSATEVKAFSIMLTSCKLLADLEETQGNFKASLHYQKQYNQVSDSLHSETNRANLEELKTKFNFEEKEREIALLKKDRELQEARIEQHNTLTWSLCLGVILMLLIIGSLFLAYRAMRSKKNSLAVKNQEIEQQKDDLDKLNNEKDRFFSILSHDLRSPLASLKGFSYLITEHVDSMTTEELMEMRTKIDSSLDSLTELLNNVLEWSMTSSRKRTWHFDKINITELVRKNIILYQTTADAKGVYLVQQTTEECCGYADYHAIDTIVRNLISNGIKFSHPKKSVTIISRQEEGLVFISVKDEGVGITPEIQEKLFRLNENVTQPGTNNEKGTGLGLTLCKELIKENKGDISVKSKPAEGSEFTLWFPEFEHYTKTVISKKSVVQHR